MKVLEGRRLIPEVRFYQQVELELIKHYQDAEFDVTQLAKALACSERQLQRKFKCIFGLSPNTHIKNFRLQKAKELVLAGERASNVAFQCGFNSPSYFSQCFKRKYGKSPIQYREQGCSE